MLLAILMACEPGKPLDTTDEPADTASPAPFDSLCASAGGAADTLALWTAEDNALSFVRLDGEIVAAHTFFPERTPESVSVSDVVAKGDWIAAIAGSYAWVDGVLAVATELALFDRSGALRWSATEDGVLSSEIWLGDDGVLAWDRGYDQLDARQAHLDGVLFLPSGDQASLDGWPIGLPVDGAVPTCDDLVCSWQDPFAATVEEARAAPEGWSASVGERQVWSEGNTAVVSQIPGESVVVALTGADPELPTAVVSVAGDWMLVTQGALAWRIDAGAGLAEAVAPTLPDGLRRFEDADYCEALPAAVDDAGAILLALRDDDRGGLWRTDAAGSTWEQLGDDVTDTLWLSGGGRAGSYAVQATSANETYCPALTWSPDPDALPGSSLQIVRDASTWSVSPTGWGAPSALPFSDDGLCAVVADEEGWKVLDLGSGERVGLSGFGGWVL